MSVGVGVGDVVDGSERGEFVLEAAIEDATLESAVAVADEMVPLIEDGASVWRA